MQLMRQTLFTKKHLLKLALGSFILPDKFADAMAARRARKIYSEIHARLITNSNDADPIDILIQDVANKVEILFNAQTVMRYNYTGTFFLISASLMMSAGVCLIVLCSRRPRCFVILNEATLREHRKHASKKQKRFILTCVGLITSIAASVLANLLYEFIR